MEELSVFHDLSGSLSEKERRELLKKINISLNLKKDTEENIYHKELDQKERDKLVMQDLNNVSWFRHLILWIQSRISGKRINEIFIAYKVNTLKNTINRQSPGLTGFETRNLTPIFAEAVFNVFVSVFPLREIYKKLWMDPDVFEQAFLYLLENKISEDKKHLEDIISINELVDVYAETGLKESLRKKVIQKMEEYIDSIAPKVFTELEDSVIPILYLKDIILFPYISFFQLFSFTPKADDYEGKPFFKNASAMLALEYIERLYYAVFTAVKVSEPIKVNEDLLIYISELIRKSEQNEETDEKGDEKTEIRRKHNEEAAKSILERLKDLNIKIKGFSRKIPLAEIIRYFLKDPYYHLGFNFPELYLKAFYSSALRSRILRETDERYLEIRKLYIEQEVQKLFKDKNIIYFQNYRDYASIDYKNIGVTFFKHIKSVNLLYNYITIFFKDFIQDAIQLLERGILSQNRITRDRMTQTVSNILDLQEKLKAFDFSLSQDTEDGKLFQRLRYSMAADISQQKIFRTIITQKDLEIKSLLERGEEYITILKNIFLEIINSPAENIKVQLNNHYFLKGKPSILKNIIKSRIENLEVFRKLLIQVKKMEEE